MPIPQKPRTEQTEPRAAVWKIDRFAIHDGPGIRTNIYFKGCSLRCAWCSNPEGQRREDELGFSETRCTRCGLCLDACPQGAITAPDGVPVVDRARCDLCRKCLEVCAPGALYIFGGLYTLSQIMDIVERDRHIYRRSGGGITCTGGEPLLQADFLKQLLAACHEVGIHTVVETCGGVNPEDFRDALANIDWLFFDLKHIDPEEHKKLTGRDDAEILNNLQYASALFAKTGKTLVIRQVVVPGLNDEENIAALGRLAAGLPRVDMVELLPYHNYGMDKYRALGRSYGLAEMAPPAPDKLDRYKKIIEGLGLKCRIGGL